jgi:uncharacterized protein
VFRSFAAAACIVFATSAVAEQRHPDAPAPAPSSTSTLSRHTEPRIPMADGISLAGDLYLPQKEGRYPLIIEMTPYGKRSPLSFVNERDYWTSQGYAFLIVDIRGLNGSEGEFGFMRDGPDGRDVVEWAARQSWSDGNVGMRGASYSGTVPWLTARLKPPHLRCINANASVATPFDGPPYMGGAFMPEWAQGWIGNFSIRRTAPAKPVDHAKLLGHRPLNTADVAAHGTELKTYRAFLAHPTLDAYWRQTMLSQKDYKSLNIPTLAFTGWFDGTLPGTVKHYRAMKRHSRAAKDQFLIIGPWQHQTVSDGGWDFESGERVSKVGDVTLPSQAFLAGQKITTEFFNWCLKGEAKPNFASTRTYITGADQWIETSQFGDGKRVSLYLADAEDRNAQDRHGQLLRAPSSNGSMRYVFDPANPMPSYLTLSGNRRTLVSEPVDISSQLGRTDVLSFTSAPLPQPVTVLGTVSIELFAASSAKDTDFVVRLEDVAPDGKAFKLGAANGGVLRTRYRRGFDRQALLTPNRPERMIINVGEIGHQFAPGHRLRISITSSSYPMLSVNPNSGQAIATDMSEPIKANQTIFFGTTKASRVILPVIDNPTPLDR